MPRRSLPPAPRSPVPLGDLEIVHDGADTGVRGELASKGALRRDDDGSHSDIHRFGLDDPGDQLTFVVGEREHGPMLTLRDGQHEYVYLAVRDAGALALSF